MPLRQTLQPSTNSPIHVAILSKARRLVEWVGASSPPGEEQTKADCLEDTSESADGHGIHRTSLGENLRDNLVTFISILHISYVDVTYTWCRAGHEDQATEISGSLVAQGTCCVDEGSDTIRLNGAANNGSTPGSGGTSSLLALEKLFLGICSLSTVVGVTEHRSKYGERCGVVEDGAHGNSRGLDGWEIYIVILLEKR